MRAIVVNGAVAERNDYTAFGARRQAPWHPRSASNRFTFNGKEAQTIGNLPVLDYGARMFVLRGFPTFTSPDPLGEKRFGTSTNVYVSNDPINKIDPDGRDEWDLNKSGEVLNRTETQEHDAFFMAETVDGAVQRTGQSLKLEYGAVAGAGTETLRGQNLTLFEMKGDDNASRLFEFMANPGVTTNVEWTHAKTGSESSGRNIVGTSHRENSTSVGSYVANKEPAIRELNHNHPNGVPIPSGADMQNATNYTGKFPGIQLNIFAPASGYSPYNGSGTMDSRINTLSDGSYMLPDGRQVKRR